MNHIQILKRSWKILWSYRTLWVFGIILALVSGGGGGQGNISGNGDAWRNPQGSWQFGPFDDFGEGMNELGEALEGIAPSDTSGWIGFAVVALCLVLVLVAISLVFQYLSRTALIRMVDQYEQSGEKVSWRQGFRLGWNRAAGRLFLIDLILYLPLALVAFLMIMCPAIPLIMAGNANRDPSVAAIVTMIGFAFLTIFLVVILGILLSLSIKFIRRECVLQDAGVGAAIRQGWNLLRSNFVDVLLMGLIILGINIGLFVVMLPLVLLLLGVSALLGGGVGFLVYAAISAGGAEVAAIVAALVLGISLFILVMVIPLSFIGGLIETYYSTVWTLAYRELKLAETLDELPGGEDYEMTGEAAEILPDKDDDALPTEDDSPVED